MNSSLRDVFYKIHVVLVRDVLFKHIEFIQSNATLLTRCAVRAGTFSFLAIATVWYVSRLLASAPQINSTKDSGSESKLVARWGTFIPQYIIIEPDNL